MRLLMIATAAWCALAAWAVAREWTDSTGKFTQHADLVDSDGRIAVLRKADGFLVAVPLDKLSDADREYIASQAGKAEVAAAASKDRTWELTNGVKAVGRVLEYGRKEMVVARRAGRIVVNDRLLAERTAMQQEVLLEIVSKKEKAPIKTVRELESLVVSRRGGPLTYVVEGVILELENGEQFAVPFFLFSERDLKVLQPGWDNWLDAEESEQQRQMHSTMLRSLANEYQRNRQIDQQIQMLQLASQWFDLWEVGLMAPNGATTSVVVPARDSFTAQTLAKQQHPNTTIIGTRRVSRRN